MRIRSQLFGYALAVLSTGVALLLTHFLPLAPTPFPLFVAAILISAWLGGFGPGVAATLLGGLAVLLMRRPHEWPSDFGWQDAVRLGAFGVVGALVALVTAMLRQAERRSRSEREQLRVTLASIGDGVLVADSAGGIVSLNPVAEALTGWTTAEAAGTAVEAVFRIVHEVTGEPVENPVSKALQQKRSVALANHTLLIARDGTRRPIDDSAAPITTGDGAITGAVLVFRDVSDRRRKERNLQESEQRHRLIAELTSDYTSTSRVTESGEVVSEMVTAGFTKVTGYTLQELQELGGWPILIPPEDLPRIQASVARLVAGERDCSEARVRTRDGGVRWVRYLGQPVFDTTGKVARIISAAQDITDQKRDELVQQEQVRLAAFGRDVGLTLAGPGSLGETLHQCTEAMVRHLGAALARIWTFNDVDDVLELRASAGMYTHLDGPHSRVPVGQFKIGWIAQERRPHFTNTVVGDERVHDQDWAKQHGLVSFAGYPLVVEDRLVGVAAMFSREPLSERTLEAIASVARGIAVGIERKRAVAQLQEEREWLAVTLNCIGDAVIATDRVGRVQFLNAVAENLTGWSQADARGQDLSAVFRIVNEDTRRVVESPVTKVLRCGTVVGLANHTALIARDGVERPIDDSAAPIRSPQGEMLGVVMVFRDISDRRASERRRQARLMVAQILAEAPGLDEAVPQLLRAIGEGLDWDVAACWTVDNSAGVLRCVDAWSRAEGGVARFEAVTRRQALEQGVGLPGRVWGSGASVWIADVAGDSSCSRHAVAAEEGLHGAVACPVGRGGEVLGVIELLSRDVREPDADFLETMTTLGNQIGHFIERKRAEESLRESEERLRMALAAGHMGTWDWDIRTNRVRWSGNLESIHGLPPGGFGGALDHFEQLVHPDDRAMVRQAIRQSLEQKVDYEAEFRNVWPDGSVHWVLGKGRTFYDDHGQPVRMIGVGMDITDRKTSEARTRAAEQRYRELVNGLDAIVWEADAATCQFTFVSDRAEHILGYPVAQWLADPNAWFRMIHPDDREYAMQFCRRATAEGIDHAFDYRAVRADGQVVWLHDTVYVVAGEDGRVQRLRGLMVDVTERKRLEKELRDRMDQLAEADRRKDEFLATLAHELRNPLAPIRNALHILELAAKDQAATEHVRQIMQRQVQHMTRLVDDLLDVSRISRGKIRLRHESVCIADVVRRAVETIHPLIVEHRHELLVAIPEQPVSLEGDPTRIEQVLDNLLNNAAKYTDPGGRIWLTVRPQDDTIEISVRDTGIGIEPEVLPHIFDLFVQAERRLDASYGGLGIGLTLVRRLVELHGGSVQARSGGAGKGSEFIVRLPASTRPERQPIPSAPADRPVAAVRRHVLIVDDNPDAAESLALLLRIQGHEVQVAYDGRDALAMIQSQPPEIVLLDIGLPGLDGFEVAKRIRQQRHCARALLIALTGWGQEEDRRRSREAGFDHHLIKPVEPETLAELMRHGTPSASQAIGSKTTGTP